MWDRLGTDYKLVIAYGFFAFYQQQVTRHELLLFCVFSRLFAANSSSPLESGRSTSLISPQKGSKFTKSYLCLMTSRGHSLAGSNQQTNLPPCQSGSLRDQGIIQFLNDRPANFTFHYGHFNFPKFPRML